MKSAVVLDEQDLKRILASYFKVDESKVIKSKYSYTVVDSKAEEIFKLQNESNH